MLQIYTKPRQSYEWGLLLTRKKRSNKQPVKRGYPLINCLFKSIKGKIRPLKTSEAWRPFALASIYVGYATDQQRLSYV